MSSTTTMAVKQMRSLTVVRKWSYSLKALCHSLQNGADNEMHMVLEEDCPIRKHSFV